MFLTEKQRERLIGRNKEEFASVKRTNDYLIREALANYLDTSDAMLILEHLPKEQIEKVVTDKHINDLLMLALKLLTVQGPGDGAYYEMPIKSEEGGKPDVIKASAADKQRVANLDAFIVGLKVVRDTRKMRSEAFDNFEFMEKNKIKTGIKRKESKQK